MDPRQLFGGIAWGARRAPRNQAGGASLSPFGGGWGQRQPKQAIPPNQIQPGMGGQPKVPTQQNPRTGVCPTCGRPWPQGR